MFRPRLPSFLASLSFLALFLVAACSSSRRPAEPPPPDPFDGGPPPDPCGLPECFETTLRWSGREAPPEDVDLLFVVDGSAGMTDVQAQLAADLPPLLLALGTGDREASDPTSPRFGEVDFSPPRSVHLGVVTTDMGSGGFHADESCSEPIFGDDGVLVGKLGVTPGGSPRACDDRFPEPWVALRSDGGPLCSEEPGVCDRAAEDVGCLVRLGNEGCRFGMPLEAMLKAVTPASASCREPTCSFFQGTRGQAANPGTNGGFFRDGSLLAVVLVTAREDCSAADADLFNPLSSRYVGDLGLRCAENPSALHPIERYVAGLAGRRSPARLVFGALSGAPVDVLERASMSNRGGLDLDAVLAEAALVPRPNAERSGLQPSCVGPHAVAEPGRRLLQTARDLDARGAAVAVGSICEETYAPFLDDVLAGLAERLEGICLPSPLPRGDDGLVPCRLVEEPRPSSPACADRPGRIPQGDGTCIVRQRDRLEASRPGWVYDDGTTARSRCPGDGGQRIDFTPGAEPGPGTTLRLACRW